MPGFRNYRPVIGRGARRLSEARGRASGPMAPKPTQSGCSADSTAGCGNHLEFSDISDVEFKDLRFRIDSRNRADMRYCVRACVSNHRFVHSFKYLTSSIEY